MADLRVQSFDSTGQWQRLWGKDVVSTGGTGFEICTGDTQITDAPKRTSKWRNATFRFDSTETGSTFECKLDKGAFEPCGSPKSYA